MVTLPVNQAFVRNFGPGLLWGCIILAITLLPGNYFPTVGSFWNLFSPDKLVHLFIFGVLGFLLLQGARKQYPGGSHRLLVIYPMLATVGLGIATEFLQAVLPIGRDANYYDAIANLAGFLLGWTASSAWNKKKKKNLQTKPKNI